MTWLLPWVLLFFLLFFFGLFCLVFFSARSQERALDSITRQQSAIRMELERLADSLDALLADRELEDRDVNPGDSADADDSGAEPEVWDKTENSSATSGEAVPGLDRLLLGPERPGASAKTQNAAPGLPDLKF